jgi:hypothetical protein
MVNCGDKAMERNWKWKRTVLDYNIPSYTLWGVVWPF